MGRRWAQLIGLMGLVVFGLSACGDDAGSGGSSSSSGVYTFTLTDDDLVVGDRDAPITIVEYSSFTCPHCAEFSENVFPTLKTKYLDTGKAKIVLRPYFWDPAAGSAAMLTYCAPERIQLPLTEALFASQRTWLLDPQGPQEGLVKIARQANISREAFSDCIKDAKTKAWAKRHLDEAANKYGINATPTFFVNGEKFGVIRDVAELDRIMAKFANESGSEGTPEDQAEDAADDPSGE